MKTLASRATAWLRDVPARNELERAHATTLQLLAFVSVAVSVVLEVYRFASGAPGHLVASASNAVNSLLLLAAVAALRRGRFRLAAWIIIAGTGLTLGAAVAFSGAAYTRDVVKNLMVVLALSALILGRRALWGTTLFFSAALAVGYARDQGLLGGSGPRLNLTAPATVVTLSIVALVLLAIIVDRFGLTVLEAFSDAMTRQRELVAAREDLERSKAALEAEADNRRRVEAQLVQSQKMEAIGRLAGGIAHDFNNLLTVIGGNTELVLSALPADDPHAESLGEIRKATDSATQLTRQLLAFSRRQVVTPRAVDVAELVGSLRRILQRILGETVTLETTAQGPAGVFIDPGQLEQVLINLAVNARDAMPPGGRLQVSVDARELTGELRGRHPSAAAGPHVRVAVSDNGCGMTDEVQQHAFEPFFTTKPAGAGTGLGLATCFGIVNQAGGFIELTSRVDQGTTVELYLPRCELGAAEVGPADAPRPSPGGSETVLLVEDADGVRSAAARMLRRLGYEVLEAADGLAALALVASLTGHLDLMITDVVMPRMSGRELADKLVTTHPETRVLFCSGYTDDVVLRHGIEGLQVSFLAKPYTQDALAAKVRELLGGRSRG